MKKTLLGLSFLMVMALPASAWAVGGGASDQASDTMRVGDMYELRGEAVELSADGYRMKFMVKEARGAAHVLVHKPVALELGAAQIKLLVAKPGGQPQPRPASLSELRVGDKIAVHAKLMAELSDDYPPKMAAKMMMVMRGPEQSEPDPQPEDECPQPPVGEEEDADNGSPALRRPNCEQPPRFHRGFLNRVWKVDGQVNAFEDGKLSLVIDRFRGLPKRFAAQDDELVQEEAVVLVSSQVRVYDTDNRRLSRSRVADALDEAEDVRLQVKLLPPARWQEDEDGLRVPTFRAKRIRILS